MTKKNQIKKNNLERFYWEKINKTAFNLAKSIIIQASDLFSNITKTLYKAK